MKEKMQILKWYDILIVAIIMFGMGVYNSTVQYFMLMNQTATIEGNLTFSSSQNYQAILTQGIWLILAFAYLYFRNFDFKVITDQIKLEKWLLLKVIAAFALAALVMDIQYIATYYLSAPPVPSMAQLGEQFDISLILYSLLNGFYEEVFFLGICLAVKPKYMTLAFLASLVIRFSFHTYQGMSTALGIGILLGTVFYLLYRWWKPKNLLPFFLAHAIADVIGLSIVFYFWR